MILCLTPTFAKKLDVYYYFTIRQMKKKLSNSTIDEGEMRNSQYCSFNFSWSALTSFQTLFTAAHMRRASAELAERRRASLGASRGLRPDGTLDPYHAAILFRDSRGVSCNNTLNIHSSLFCGPVYTYLLWLLHTHRAYCSRFKSYFNLQQLLSIELVWCGLLAESTTFSPMYRAWAWASSAYV